MDCIWRIHTSKSLWGFSFVCIKFWNKCFCFNFFDVFVSNVNVWINLQFIWRLHYPNPFDLFHENSNVLCSLLTFIYASIYFTSNVHVHSIFKSVKLSLEFIWIYLIFRLTCTRASTTHNPEYCHHGSTSVHIHLFSKRNFKWSKCCLNSSLSFRGSFKFSRY